MRRKEREITDLGKIEEIILKSPVCRLGLCDHGQPYVVPVNFGYADRKIYIHCAPEGKKIEILKQNNKVCFECDTDIEITHTAVACKCGCKYRSIIGTGKATLISDNEEKRKACEILMRHYAPGSFTFADSEIEAIAILTAIDIDHLSGKQCGYSDMAYFLTDPVQARLLRQNWIPTYGRYSISVVTCRSSKSFSWNLWNRMGMTFHFLFRSIRTLVRQENSMRPDFSCRLLTATLDKKKTWTSRIDLACTLLEFWPDDEAWLPFSSRTLESRYPSIRYQNFVDAPVC